MNESSFVPTSDYSARATIPASTPRLPGHLAFLVILGMALVSWIVVWQLVEAVAMVIDALT